MTEDPMKLARRAPAMDRRSGLGLLLGGLALGWTASAHAHAAPSRVLLLATIHGMHAKVPTYSYEDVYRIVADFRPDVVGVEIRQEDLAQPDAYLARSYPKEMIELARRYKDRVFGFDWLGADLEGRPIPDDYWQNESWVKALELEMDAHPLTRSPRDLAARRAMEAAQAAMDQMVRTATPASMNDARYEALSRAYYRQFRRLTAGSRFARLSDFYAERDRRLAASVAAVVARRAGLRIAVATGADHRAAVAERLRAMRPQVALEPVTA